ncbi:23S rRNA (uracil(1939)-C(5))-methyltransferase RlmD [Geobacter sp. DSM 9736]|uniref:23S rRNA (uracil(1939)-C(5))-methyltransferase RlmD n=1 Tax=Geobacter sp. DSM 9736 TaxID=1277350 RepID=UPI000B502517|nr:23S rRNA (uracil(1939)-C(5))-methyltransferase RlmD [Geobacter sp. DSM 9736]SNB45720.1 23S rRNA m(5)U-1939 methyltransferase [Geobacter sp. DSM 9736]
MDKKRQPAINGAQVGQSLDVTITSLDRDGYGRGTVESQQVKVAGGLPGETARVKVTHCSRNIIHADLIRVLRHSPDRLITKNCAISSECEGCPILPMKYSAQLAWKQAMVKAELEKVLPPGAVSLSPTTPSPSPFNYRNSAKLVVAGKHALPQIGIYKRNSHDVIDIENCALHHPLINTIIKTVKQGIKKGKVPIYSPRTGSGLLRYLVIRVSSSENRAMVIFVTADRSYNEIHHLARHLQAAVPEVAVVAQNVNSSTGNIILGPRDHFLTRQQTLIDAIGNIRFSISPHSFFQVNSGCAAILYKKVREYADLNGTERVLDLYCGVGGISLFLADQAREVMGIESVQAAVADAERNAKLNGVSNCRFLAGDVAELLEDAGRADVVILNPPRKGCDEVVLRKAAQLEPDRMIYVSCSPISLARDLKLLHELGYVATSVQPVDMFPQTPHVENVTLIIKK